MHDVKIPIAAQSSSRDEFQTPLPNSTAKVCVMSGDTEGDMYVSFVADQKPEGAQEVLVNVEDPPFQVDANFRYGANQDPSNVGPPVGGFALELKEGKTWHGCVPSVKCNTAEPGRVIKLGARVRYVDDIGLEVWTPCFGLIVKTVCQDGVCSLDAGGCEQGPPSV